MNEKARIQERRSLMMQPVGLCVCVCCRVCGETPNLPSSRSKGLVALTMSCHMKQTQSAKERRGERGITPRAKTKTKNMNVSGGKQAMKREIKVDGGWLWGGCGDGWGCVVAVRTSPSSGHCCHSRSSLLYGAMNGTVQTCDVCKQHKRNTH